MKAPTTPPSHTACRASSALLVERRLQLACDALAYLSSLSYAVEKAHQVAEQVRATEDVNEHAEGVEECAAIAQSLITYMAARFGDAARGVPSAKRVGDAAGWVMPQHLANALTDVEQELSQ